MDQELYGTKISALIDRGRPFISVVIPCYKVSAQILSVIDRIGPECSEILVVDDCCPENSGSHVEATCSDPRVRVLRHVVNQGVGGAMVTGYRAALRSGADIVVKLDGDGQMNPALMQHFCQPIIDGSADYVKGNRFYNIEDVKAMPRVRFLGNIALTFLTKLSSGYWSLFDPNNGYVAIDARVLSLVPLDKIEKRYFFESDMLFRLNTLRARVVDLPMRAVYEDEASSLKPGRMISHFLVRHLRNSVKRVFYSYYLRDFSLASLELLVGSIMLAFGIVFGSVTWFVNSRAGVVSTTGTVMLSVLPILVGIQLLLAFLGFDMANSPDEPVGSSVGHQRGDRKLESRGDLILGTAPSP